MSGGTIAVIIVVVVVIIAALAAAGMMARRRRLQQQFGPEYDRAVTEQNSKLRAEAELADRQRRVRKLDIRPLSEASRAQYAADWVTVQERFVDSPESAVSDAYALVSAVMEERGYPTTDDDQVLSDLSVEHARTVGHFRSAQELSASAAAGTAATEDLRQALIHYRALFSDLLGETGAAPAAAMTVTEPADASPAATTPLGTMPDATEDGVTAPASGYPGSSYAQSSNGSDQDAAPAAPGSVAVGTPAADRPDSQR